MPLCTKGRQKYRSKQRVIMAERMAVCSRMYLAGKTYDQIAKETGLSLPTVAEAMHRQRAEWLASAKVNFDEGMSKELARLDFLEREALEAWEKSKVKGEEASVETTEGVKGNKGVPVKKTSMRKWGRDGDPRFMQVMMDCIKKRCELLGFDAAKKVDVGGSVGMMVVHCPIPIEEITGPSPKQMKEIEANVTTIATTAVQYNIVAEIQGCTSGTAPQS